MTTLTSELSGFTQQKNRLIQVAGEMRSLAEKLGDSSRGIEISRIQTALGQDSIKVAVIGEFKGGKSTLVNALIGKELLPTWTDECSAAIVQLRYGENQDAEVFYSDLHRQPISINELTHVATVENPDFQKIEYVDVRYPSDILQNGLIVVDTPGTNSAERARELITLRFLNVADAAILVLNAEYLLTAKEEAFILSEISPRNYDRVFVVVNRCDVYRDEKDRLTAALKKCLERLHQLIPGVEKIYPLSALDAMEGRMDQDLNRVRESGIEVLENDLANLAVRGSGMNRLKRIASVFREILSQWQMDLDIRIGSLGLDQEKVDVQIHKIEAILQEEQSAVAEILDRVQEGFSVHSARLENELSQMADKSRSTIEREYSSGKKRIDEREVEELVFSEAKRWLQHADNSWRKFQDEVMGWTANQLSRIDSRMTESFRSLLPVVVKPSNQLAISPVRISIQIHQREEVEYVEEERPVVVSEPAPEQRDSDGLGLGMLALGVAFGGIFGGVLALFGGLSLLENRSNSGKSIQRTVKEIIRKPVQRIVQEYRLGSLEAQYDQIKSEIFGQVSQIMAKSLIEIRRQVEAITHSHFDQLHERLNRMREENKSNSKDSTVALLSTHREKVVEILRFLEN